MRVMPVALAALVLLAGCGDDGALLVVDVRTDLVPAADFASVETLLAGSPFTASTEARRVATGDLAGADFIAGERVAEFDGVASGTAYLRVKLLASDGTTVLSRDLAATVEGDIAVTVVLTRSCSGVLCPQPGDPASHTACEGGGCVDPRCSPEAPEYCEEPQCTADGDCPATGCLSGACRSGLCFVVTDDARCGAGQRCETSGECVADRRDAGAGDAGPRDAGLRDAGPRDAGPRDAGPGDAGLVLSANFCPDAPLLRQQIAILLVRYVHGASFVPPAAVGMFSDVPRGSPTEPWIEQLVRDGVTAGCGTGIFCPTDPVLREQAATFIIRAEHGASYTPPPATGVFSDVVISSFHARFIEQIYREGITDGCGAGIYCPADPLLRSHAAVFFVRLMHGPTYTPPSAVGLFDDVPSGHPQAAFIEQLARDGLTNGCGG